MPGVVLNPRVATVPFRLTAEDGEDVVTERRGIGEWMGPRGPVAVAALAKDIVRLWAKLHGVDSLIVRGGEVDGIAGGGELEGDVELAAAGGFGQI